MHKEKGRKCCGENHPSAKLKVPQVIEMRELYEGGGWTYKELAEKYGVCIRSVSQIMDGTSWKSVTGGVPVSKESRIAGKIIRAKKLTPDDVKAIREEYMSNMEVTQKELGVRYGIAQSGISKVIRGKTWKFVM